MSRKNWVPFHEQLAKGPKRVLPRAVRFVFLELALESRRNDGRIDLAIGWDTVDAVHHLLSGNRAEIKKAIEMLSRESSTEPGAIKIINNDARHSLEVVKFAEYATVNTDKVRQRKCRDAKKETSDNANLRELVTAIVTVEPDNAKPACHVTVTATGQDITRQDSGVERDGAAPAAPAHPVEPGSETRLRVASKPGTTLPHKFASPEIQTIAEAIMADPVFASLSAPDVAARLEGHRMSKGTPMADVVRAIGQCGDACVGLGMRPDALQSKLVAFCKFIRRERTPSTTEVSDAIEDTLRAEEKALREQISSWSKAGTS